MKKLVIIGGIFVLLLVAALYMMLQDANQKQPIQTNIHSISQTQKQPQLANPASVNCEKVGGQSVIENGPNGQYGLCDFGSGMMCEEWALFRGECPVGGVKTTGFNTIQQKYCAWVGGETTTNTNAVCTFKNQSKCALDALYNGTCQMSAE